MTGVMVRGACTVEEAADLLDVGVFSRRFPAVFDALSRETVAGATWTPVAANPPPRRPGLARHPYSHGRNSR